MERNHQYNQTKRVRLIVYNRQILHRIYEIKKYKKRIHINEGRTQN